MYTNHDGLAQMQVVSVFTDSRGLLWVGTKWGVSRFNGERFTSLSPSLLRGAEFRGITEDQRGNMWFTKGDNMGSTCYDGHRARVFNEATYTPAFDRENRGWTINPDKHLAYIDGDNVLRADRLIPQLRNDSILHLFYDKSSEQLVLVTSKDKCFRYRNNQLHTVDFPFTMFGAPDASYNDRGLRLISEPQTHIYRTYRPGGRSGLILVYFDGKHFVPFLEQNRANGTIKWLQTLPTDCFIILDGKVHFVPRKTTQLYAQITTVGDYEKLARIGNNYFVGTEQGLFRLTNTGFRYFDRQQAPYVWSVVEDKEGTIWWLNFRSPILTWDGQRVKKRQDYQLPSDDWYYHSQRGHDGNLYLAHGQGIVRFDGRHYRLMRVPDLKQPCYSLDLLEDSRRGSWLQGSEGGVHIYRNGRYLRSINPAADSIPNLGNYFALAQDQAGNYWIGGGGGLFQYNPDTRQRRAYTTQNHRFPRGTVLGLKFDTTGRLWIASTKGLAWLDSKTDSIRFVGRELFNLPIAYLGVAGKYLLAGDLKALYILDLDYFNRTGQLSVKGYNQHNGFMGIEPGQNGFYHDSKNRVWITSGSVLSYLDLNQFQFQTEPLRAGIYSVNDSLLTFAHRADSIIRLLKGQNMAKVIFEAIGFDRTEDGQYRYRVDEDSWSGWLSTTEVYLSNLTHGVHLFTVEARRNSLAGEAPALATFRFAVDLPLWRRTLFEYFSLLLLTAGLVGFSYLIYRNNRNSLRLQQQDQQLLFLQVQTLQAQLNPHFVFNVLGTLQKMIMTNDREQANNNLVRLARLIRSFLEASIQSELPQKSRSAELELPLAKELELLELYMEFEQLQYQDQFSYSLEVDKEIEPTVWSIPPMLVQPFVENAIKHGLLHRKEPGHLSVRFKLTSEETLLVEIEDNGMGRDEAKRLQDASIRPYVSRGSGLVEHRIAVLNTIGYKIKLNITDPPSGGTSVKLLISTNGYASQQSIFARLYRRGYSSQSN